MCVFELLRKGDRELEFRLVKQDNLILRLEYYKWEEENISSLQEGDRFVFKDGLVCTKNIETVPLKGV